MDAFNGMLNMRCVKHVGRQFHCDALLYAGTLCMHKVLVCVRASGVRIGFLCVPNAVYTACSLFQESYTR